tara:strand:- start:2954 stop:4582 length:1629 start_codon:yes stop_codon:yes gene_type:complete
MSIFTLIRAFQKAKGRSPSPSELAKLKKQAQTMVEKSKIIKPDFSKNNPQDWTGLPKVLKDVKNPNQVKKLLESGDIKIGQVTKTTPKAPVDPKFKAAVDKQTETSRLVKEFELRNKENAYKSAFRKYKESVDKKPMDSKGILDIYRNLAKYPKGRQIILGDISDIERGFMFNTMGNRSRADLVKKLNKLYSEAPPKDPFKQTVKDPSDQLEMDFTDWDPKGMAGGGLAYMLGEEPRVGMMYGGDPGFAFEYGGSWADWRDNHQHMMPIMEYIGTKLPKERTPFRQGINEGGRIGFDKGGMSRRNFLKLMAGLASIPVVGKYFKFAKPAAKTLKAVEASNATGMPAWFPKLVDKVLKEGKDVSKQYATTERVIVKEAQLPNSKTKIIVEHDLNTGDTIVDIGEGKHGWVDGRHGQPTRLTLQKGEWIEPDMDLATGKLKNPRKKKAVKTKDEFDVEEAEFTGDAESVKYEESVVEKYGDHASDFTEVEKYATGKNVDKYNLKGTKKREADEWAQGRAEADAERWADEADDFASGGVAKLLGE